ncbi:MAG TPA: hypothetical protein VGW37_18350 [Terriglobia bacterium]|nr:hypothetical protein [Terriglobia bacterium]
MNTFKRIQELPAELRDYIQLVKADKGINRQKENRKGPALEALRRVLPQGAKSVFVVTRKGVILADINPQSHAQFDPEDPSPEIKAVLDAQVELAAAQLKLNGAIAAGKAAGKITVASEDSIRVEVLTPAKLIPIMQKHGQDIRVLRRKPVLALAA